MNPDTLPRSRWETYRMLLEGSGIDDHDSDKADTAVRLWQLGKKGKPRAWEGGELDGICDPSEKPRSLFHAFMLASVGAKTWRDLLPVVERMRAFPGMEGLRVPEAVMLRHAIEDEDARDYPATILEPCYDEVLPVCFWNDCKWGRITTLPCEVNV